MVEIDFRDLAPTMSWPSDLSRDEGFWKSWDSTDIYWQRWNAAEPRGVIALMHGYGEHSTRYHHVAAALNRAGFTVWAIDLRGHGKSAGIRGHAMDYDDFVRDYDMLLSHVKKATDLPLFCLGHSNGGLIVLRHSLLYSDARIKGYVVTSPFCGFKVVVPKAKATLGNVMSNIWPSLSIPTGLDAAVLSHRPEVVETYKHDPLVLSKATARWFTETKRAQADLKARARTIQKPFLFLVAGSDELADPRVAEEVFHQIGSTDREFEVFPELFHEILNEDSWPDHVRHIVGWMEKRMS